MSTDNPGSGELTDEERARLRRDFDLLPKVVGHGETALERHDDIRPEWVMLIVAAPHERYDATGSRGDQRTVLTGRVPESPQWIMVVFVGSPETGEFLTAFHNRDLEEKYGGRPWTNQ